jgi:lysocardiolipin and lysophospholipid acyltransferase
MVYFGGVMILMLMFISAVFATLYFMFPVVMLLLPFDPSSYHIVTRFVACHWLRFSASLIERLGGVRFFFSGDCKPEGERKILVICNHRTRLDWMFLWSFFARLGLLGSLKIIMKAELKFAPFFGWGMQCFPYIFLTRKWEQDKSYLEQVLPYLSKQQDVCFLIFPEGTDLSESNVKKSQDWSQKKGLKSKTHTLQPRVKGFVHTVQLLRSSIDSVYDVTMAYVDRDERPNEKSIVTGHLPKEIHCHNQRYAMTDLPKSDEELSAWLEARFDEKEAALEHFYGGTSPTEKRRLSARKANLPSPTNAFLVSTVVWLLAGMLVWQWYKAAFSSALLYTVFSSAAFWAVSRFYGGVDMLELQRYAPRAHPKED